MHSNQKFWKKVTVKQLSSGQANGYISDGVDTYMGYKENNF